MQKSRFNLFIFFVLLCLCLLTGNTHSVKANDIVFDSLQWKARVLVLTGQRNDALLVEQVDILKQNLQGLRERSIAVIRFDGDAIYEMEDLSSFDYRGRYNMRASLQGYYEDEMQSDNNEFSVVLFGKDGDFKKVWKDRKVSVPIEDVFSIIDAMPMRQREIQR